MPDGTPVENQPSPARPLPTPQGRDWYMWVAVILLIVAAFFRLWRLGAAPPGMHAEELINAQISDRLREGDVSVIYDEVEPAREGLYYAILAVSTTLIGRGLILWRLPSVWIAMLSLAFTARLMRRLFGRRVSLMTLGLLAVGFWPVWMGRSVLHVTLLPLATVVVAYTLVRAFEAHDQATSSMWFTVGGLALGATQYVHVTSWTMLLLVPLLAAYRWLVNRQDLRRHWSNIIYALSLTLVLCLPLIIFLARHPGAREPVPVAEQPGLIAEIPGRLVSSLAALALRGDMLPSHNLPGRPVMEPVIAVLTVVGLGVCIARWQRPAYGLAVLWLLVGLLPTALLPRRADFEFMAVILPIVFAFPAIGLRTIYIVLRQKLPALSRRVALSAVGVLVAVLIAGDAVWTFRDYFLTWPTLGDVRLAYQADLGVLARYLDTSQDPTPVSVCSSPVDRAREPFALTNQELLAYLMHRHNLPIRYFDCTQSLVLANGGESQRLIFPRGHYYDHLPGPLLAWMRFAHDEHVPGIRPDVVMRFEASQQVANRVGAFITTAPTAWPPEAGIQQLAELPVTFGYNLSFLGYEVRSNTVRPAEWIELTTYWRVDGPPPPELTLFAHLLSNPVVILAQSDSLGVQVGTLQTRDIFLQYSMIQIPGGVTSGLYPLSVGMYFPRTGQRLPVFDGNVARADRLFLERVAIEP